MISQTIKFQKSRIPSDGLSLGHFVFQTKIRSLYRNILRETRYLGTNQIRRETISWIRYEFMKPIPGKLDKHNNQDFLAQINRQLKQIKNSSMLIGGGFEKLRGGRN
ncbi:hypothetical protein PtA15_4A514 [Puccinia triticina]|uniref:Complex 1 LYR protein domain-containing protein n=1 Tax=Puccinia triticina TaxID=208348 RepID=A0ABY7CGN2_9BASI|nr:uncharacterized protein PtA15_4A514 [Puccinia triticina]WAQ84063.1 hypothetical protein PtA15_4A514 [Puccinia triticina]WAR54903.1 hypothetical protein PtB15_4B521 [Puccinia triticina]